MRARSAGRSLGAGGRRMADAVLFEFLHTEMVAELWAHDPDPGPGGQNMSLSVLEGMGFRVGQALGERLSRETLAYREELDILKFLCKDLWMAVFQKQMDSLRTNHQGTYVLQDNSFPLLIRMASGLQYLEEAPKVWGCWEPPAISLPLFTQPPPQGRPRAQGEDWPHCEARSPVWPRSWVLAPSSHSDLCPPPPVPGLHLRPPAWHPLHPGRQEPGHRLRGSPACL
uniref:Trafficking protein particle complex subunit 6A n=1 Tax=Equus asinus TaxID=9793 RepID=A0A9L0IBX6_EQUAS